MAIVTIDSFPPSLDAERTYRIGELASEFDVTLRTLRFYEDKGLIAPRRVGSTRLYSRADRARLKIILLGKRVGLSLVDIREILELYDPSGNNLRQLEVAVAKGQIQLETLRSERTKIDAAICELEATVKHIQGLIAEVKAG